MCVCMYVIPLAFVTGNSEPAFLIATTLRCSEEQYSFLWIAPLSLDSYITMMNVKGGIKYHFKSL